MDNELKSHLKLITKRIDSAAMESMKANGFSEKTARLRLLAELVREQVESQAIPFSNEMLERINPRK